ncbi:MAG: type I 3-dehydroquinate dehydratase [Verrucomicrobia bacterium]|nr:type I 3-dehydroquinate dehydratase [Verrucomicrobiota bacterium]MCH8528991.1 type I 3-dehydroquinate dehydratase [Kiritimatiellia bacterium]
MNTFHLGPLSLDRPRVIGTVLSAAFFNQLSPDIRKQCDAVEARLDGFDLTDLPAVLQAIQRAEALGIPVIATLRLPEDGGKWTGADAARLPILEAVLKVASTIDIEADSALRPALCEQAAALGKPIIVSRHDFNGTPPLADLNRMIEDMLATPNALPKFAVRVDREADIITLMHLVAQHALTRPLCVMGMGDPGTPTRTALPALGTKFTYGYLDQPSAPGQKSAGEILTILKQLM